jgi:hypothetical protein
VGEYLGRTYAVGCTQELATTYEVGTATVVVEGVT